MFSVATRKSVIVHVAYVLLRLDSAALEQLL